jgi:hypothetical protein
LGLAAYAIVGQHPDSFIPSQHQRFLTTFFVAASLIIGESHQFTSIIRYYGAFRSRKKAYRWQRVPFWILYGLVLLVACSIWFNANNLMLIPLLIAQVAVVTFPMVLMQHFCAQAMAIGLVYCRMEGYIIGQSERRSISLIAWMLTAAGAFTIATPFGSNQPPQNLSAIFHISATFMVLVFFAHVLRRGCGKGEWLPAGAAVMWMNLAIFVLLPLPPIMFYVWMFVPLFYHASQHWVLAWVTQQKEAAQRDPAASRKVITDVCRLALPIQAVSLVVLFLPMLGRQFFSDVPSEIFGNGTLNVGWSMLVFYVHYFADRVVWRPTT